MATNVTVTGLTPLVATLKGPLFKDVNKELRQFSTLIAKDLVPAVSAAVAQSGAPQAAAVSKTVRAHSDRVPVVVVGKTNPRGMRQRPGGAPIKLRRGAVAHGVVYGPKGGKASTAVDENYYRIPRDDSGGALGRLLEAPGGAIFQQATDVYLKVYASVMRKYGFIGASVNAMHWKG